METAKDVLGEGSTDIELLEYAAENDLVLFTHDKKDFAGRLGMDIDHSGIVIYTDPVFPRRSPETAVHVLERILDHYSTMELAGSLIWLDQWREK